MATDDKTDRLIRMNLPMSRLVKNEKNPNKMTARAFDLLVDNIQKTGLTDAILVRPLDLAKIIKIQEEATDQADLEKRVLSSGVQFRIVGGHHRYNAAAFLSYTEVPTTIITAEDFDDDAETFQMVRMNAIHGDTDPMAFLNLYNELSPKYADEILQDAFGFAEEAEFRALIEHTANSISDPTMKKKFKEAAAEIKTIDGLTKILNTLFTNYGDTLPYGFMVFDHGGQRSMWLRIDGKTMDALELIGDLCLEQQRTVDDIIGYVLQKAAKGELPELLVEAIDKTKPVVLPENFALPPTKENMLKLGQLNA